MKQDTLLLSNWQLKIFMSLQWLSAGNPTPLLILEACLVTQSTSTVKNVAYSELRCTCIVCRKYHALSLCFRVKELTRERLHHIFSQNTFHFEDSDYFFENSNSERNLKLPDVLIDLSQYEDPRLLQNSLHLLNRYQ